MEEKENKFKVFSNLGRPPHFSTPQEMADKMQEYFNLFEVIDNKPPKKQGRPTVTGLTLHLGFCDKKSLRDYKEKPEFSPLIKIALTFVEMNYEEMLDSKSSTGAIFALKNMGWDDKRIIDADVNNKMTGSIDVSQWIQNRADSETDAES